MTSSNISAEVRRFILTSIPSVPHLDAILLLRNETNENWTTERAAQRLYLNEKSVAGLLAELASAGIIEATDASPPVYLYHPHGDALRQLIDQLATAYAKHLVEVTHLIHSKTDRKAQRFADAFKLRKDS